MDLGELMKLAEEVEDRRSPTSSTKDQLVTAILSRRAEEEGFLYRKGVLDVLPDGYGFLRTQGYLPSEEDVYVSMSQIRRFGLRRGDEVSGHHPSAEGLREVLRAAAHRERQRPRPGRRRAGGRPSTS